MDLPPAGHDPVLLQEILHYLKPTAGQTYIDCTLGRAGHASAIAPMLGKAGLLIGLDVDPRNLDYAKQVLANAPCQVRLFHANFAELPDVLREVSSSPSTSRDRGAESSTSEKTAPLRSPLVASKTESFKVDLILADLGLSTNQLFDPHYGLSFAADMPLDMRIDPRLDRSAADLVNTLSESDLANLLFNLAQERHSHRIARKIIEARRSSPIKTTAHLSDLVRQALPRTHSKEKIDPATRTFLAVRMAVNHEMENLQSLLTHAPAALKPAGRLAIISFQSMEDRLVKQSFRSLESTEEFQLLTKKPIAPTDQEIALNPRSRSAKLRVAMRLQSRL